MQVMSTVVTETGGGLSPATAGPVRARHFRSKSRHCDPVA